MKILLIEPYFTGSHAAWAEGFRRYSRHDVQLLTLKGRFWKWRMHGGAVTAARQFEDGIFDPDLLLATDMLDLSAFLSLTRRQTSSIPTAVYFHENQISYPWPDQDRDKLQGRDRHYGFINYLSALAADRVFFNSDYHRDSFFEELPRFLKHFPDYNELDTVKSIIEKSEVLPLGLDLERLESPTDVGKTGPKEDNAGNAGRPPLLLWNHRWEQDKNPSEFFEALKILAERKIDFQVAVLGENFQKSPGVFLEAEGALGDRIVQFGYTKQFREYADWLSKADLIPVTSHQDFFGAAVAEAIYCGCAPLLPRRLAYPSLVSPDLYPECYYVDFDDLVSKLEEALLNIEVVRKRSYAQLIEDYDWSHMASVYDRRLQSLLT